MMGTELKCETIDFDLDSYRALQIKAAETERSFSEIVNEAAKHFLAEGADDLRAFRERDEQALV